MRAVFIDYLQSRYSLEAQAWLINLGAQRLVLWIEAGPQGNGLAVVGTEANTMDHMPEDLKHLAAFVAGALKGGGQHQGQVLLDAEGSQTPLYKSVDVVGFITPVAHALRRDLRARLVALAWVKQNKDQGEVRTYSVSSADPEPMVQLPGHMNFMARQARARLTNRTN